MAARVKQTSRRKNPGIDANSENRPPKDRNSGGGPATGGGGLAAGPRRKLPRYIIVQNNEISWQGK
jgi:hypothetical protein